MHRGKRGAFSLSIFLFRFRREEKRTFSLFTLHSDSEPLEIGMLIMGHSLIRSLVRSLAHSLAPELVGQRNIFVQFARCSESLCRPKNLSEVSFIYTGAWASSPVQYQDTLRDFHGCQEKSSIPTRKRIMHGMRSKLREDGNYPKEW